MALGAASRWRVCEKPLGTVSLRLSIPAALSSVPARLAPVAQLDRASDYGSGGWGFESSRARHSLLTHPLDRWPRLHARVCWLSPPGKKQNPLRSRPRTSLRWPNTTLAGRHDLSALRLERAGGTRARSGFILRVDPQHAQPYLSGQSLDSNLPRRHHAGADTA